MLFLVQIKTRAFFEEPIPERHYLVGNSKITHDRNGTRTILHKNAMLVVVWYSHLTWQFEFDRFLFQFKTVCTSLQKMIFAPNQDPSIFLGEPIPERYFLVGNSKITHNRNGTRTILHKNAMLVVSSLVFTFNLTIWIWPFSFPTKTLDVKVCKKRSFCPNQDPTEPFLGSQYLKGTFWWGISKSQNRNGTRTILHKNAMLVVVWYSHLTWKLEFDRFLFQLKLLMYKSWNNDFFGPNQDPSIFGGVNTWKALSGEEV